MAQRQHRESIPIPAGRGTIFDRTGVQLAIGEQTTTIYADPRELTEPRKIAVAAHKLLGVDANQLYPQLLNRQKSFVYVARFADPKAAAAFLKQEVHRRQLVPRGEARRTRRAPSARSSSATPAPTTRASPGSRCSTTRRSPASRASRRSFATRSVARST